MREELKFVYIGDSMNIANLKVGDRIRPISMYDEWFMRGAIDYWEVVEISKNAIRVKPHVKDEKKLEVVLKEMERETLDNYWWSLPIRIKIELLEYVQLDVSGSELFGWERWQYENNKERC
jgi:hypothetical protein